MTAKFHRDLSNCSAAIVCAQSEHSDVCEHAKQFRGAKFLGGCRPLLPPPLVVALKPSREIMGHKTFRSIIPQVFLLILIFS